MDELAIVERYHALCISDTLSRIGAPAIPALSEALKDLDEQLREYAVRAFSRMGGAAIEAIPVLIQALADPEEEVRTYSAYALANLGGAAKDAVPALIEALEDDSERVQHHVVYALEKIDTPEAKEALIALYP